jgi:hypothetical protein
MALPDGFQFDQSKLQDYVDCPRRFQLRHVLMQPWPALITESPLEREQHLQRGARFHRMAHQHFLGLDDDLLAAAVDDDTLLSWWHTFLSAQPKDLPATVRRAEIVLTAPLGDYRLLARFDLLAVDPGERLAIVDWKTAFKAPSRATLARRMQTRLYRFLAVEALGRARHGRERGEKSGLTLFGSESLQPEQVEMVYWFAQAGGATQSFPYDAAQYAADRPHLESLLGEIASYEAPVWPLTANERHCRFCNYRSLCDRGVQAGFLSELEDDLEHLDDLEIDLEQIAEIEF